VGYSDGDTTGRNGWHIGVHLSRPPRCRSVSGSTISFTVTNTTDHSYRVSITYEFDTPSSGEAAGSSPISLAPHTSWKVTFTRRAREAGAYKAIIRAHDALGTSHATATATAG
jgi:hypothetical protein